MKVKDLISALLECDPEMDVRGEWEGTWNDVHAVYIWATQHADDLLRFKQPTVDINADKGAVYLPVDGILYGQFEPGSIIALCPDRPEYLEKFGHLLAKPTKK